MGNPFFSLRMKVKEKLKKERNGYNIYQWL